MREARDGPAAEELSVALTAALASYILPVSIFFRFHNPQAVAARVEVARVRVALHRLYAHHHLGWRVPDGRRSPNSHNTRNPATSVLNTEFAPKRKNQLIPAAVCYPDDRT